MTEPSPAPQAWRCDDCQKLHLTDSKPVWIDVALPGSAISTPLAICPSCWQELVCRTREENPWEGVPA